VPVYRVNGVFAVVGGWFFTAFSAFSLASLFAVSIYFGKLIAIVVLIIFAVLIILRTHILHRKKEEEKETLVQTEREAVPFEFAWDL